MFIWTKYMTPYQNFVIPLNLHEHSNTCTACILILMSLISIQFNYHLISFLEWKWILFKNYEAGDRKSLNCLYICQKALLPFSLNFKETEDNLSPMNIRYRLLIDTEIMQVPRNIS